MDNLDGKEKAVTMESEYDRKFEEMKSYIPFLESMIKRLESSSTASANPRQAQLDKIRSLRDLLLDKKKRMKMDNLLKCEQVLVNLYTKVEQRDTLPGIKKASERLFPSDASTETQKSDLNTARSKLKTVVTKSKLSENDTLPEIAPACETEVVCTPGSKEPALFQRRPNKNSRSPLKKSPTKESAGRNTPQKTFPKRNYTRVLVSPEPDLRRWTPSKDLTADQPLFSRRSCKSPKKSSPQKKDKRSSSNQSRGRDLNITLKVPEESLDSLNTGDILSRIIKCPDNDVDIDTLRDLRTQILGELKQTGTNDDISDLILKSYKSKKKKNKNKRKLEVEEGELSDSESEAIKSIYGNLVVVNDDKTKNNLSQTASTSSDKDIQPRKIQICLVINSDKEQLNDQVTEIPDYEIFDIEKSGSTEVADIAFRKDNQKENNKTATMKKSRENQTNTTVTKNKDLLTIEVEDDDDLKKDDNSNIERKESESCCIEISSSDTDCQSPKIEKLNDKTNAAFKPNFYNEQKENEKVNTQVQQETQIESTQTPSNSSSSNSDNIRVPEKLQTTSTIASPIQEKKNENQLDKQKSEPEKNQKDNVEIPLMNTEPKETTHAKQDSVSEIDILQALKNEILSDSIVIPGSEAATPLLHQPKVTKVASAQEITSKKRISIEKYKEKSVSATKPSLFLKDPKIKQSTENSKKSSLKLTEQEQQRFNILPLPLDSSDEEDKESTPFLSEGNYGDMAPQSPENNDKIISGPSSPIIIPVDPVKPTIAMSKNDVDMRTLMPILSPNAPMSSNVSSSQFKSVSNKLLETNAERQTERQELRRAPLLDPRVRRDFNNSLGKDSPNTQRTPRHLASFGSAHPKMTPNSTPNARTFEMTPSRQSFDFDESSGRKHVYAPFPTFEPRDQREQSVNRDTQGPRWEPNVEPLLEDRNSKWDLWKDTDLRDKGQSRKWNDRDQRGHVSRESSSDYQKSRRETDKYVSNNRKDSYSHEQNDDDYMYSRMECPRTPIHSFGRSDCPSTPTPSFGRDPPNNSFGKTDWRSEAPMTPSHPFGRSECPTTPVHSFGRTDWRSEAPMTPSHPFGRSDTPMTPSHPFGRTDAPMTPSHPFGRPDAPMTPSHPFGRSDAPMTQSHPFGRSDAPMTPSHPFGRSDAPMTPSHTFGRSDAPMTPSHPFGRPDMSVAPMTPSHPFGRSEYKSTSAKQVKDPRLNRNTEHETNSRKFDDDRGVYYKDRRKSDLSYETRSNPNYREQNNFGKNDRNQFIRERTPGRGREPSMGRSLPREYENDQLYNRDRGADRRNEYIREKEHGRRNYKEAGPLRDYRSQSVGRSGVADERFQKSSSRGSTDGRYYPKQSNDNTLSVTPQSGRSFTIDTSVNSTFQEFLNEKGLQTLENSFNSRRKRAASVGRTLTQEASVGRNFRESSVGRTLSKHHSVEQDTSGYRNMVNFVRARSMGREFVEAKEKSFKEIKAELRSYKTNYSCKETDNNFASDNKICHRDSLSRKERFTKHSVQKKHSQSNKKDVYSPRKNQRDPRMHRDPNFERKSRFEEKKKTYGIVYSSDNIAKGTILGSGYGVKNYKIPKIKKPVEEIALEEKKETNAKNETVKDKTLPKKDTIEKGCKEKTKTDAVEMKKKKTNKIEKEEKKAHEIKFVDDTRHENDNKLTSRRTKQNKLYNTTGSDNEHITKTKKTKKLVIESDSESDAIDEKQKEHDENLKKNKTNTNDIHNEPEKNDDALMLNSSFGLDDLENIFPESMNSEPKINLEALIAHLDNNIDTTKAEELTKDINLENMFESINSPEENMNEALLSDVIDSLESCSSQKQDKDVSKELEVPISENNLNDQNVMQISSNIDKSVNNNIDQPLQPAIDCKSNEGVKVTVSQINQENDSKVNSCNILDVCSDTVTFQNSARSFQSDLIESNDLNNENVVSTTKTEHEVSEKKYGLTSLDSTLSTSVIPQHKSNEEDGLPDSTDEKNEMLSDVSSTRDQTETTTKDAENLIENPATSIGNILSILQDKSKIKELLSMLGETQTGENEKIKKKLEKLSEIVSDDDDTNEVIKDENIEKQIKDDEKAIEDIKDSVKYGAVTKGLIEDETKKDLCVSDTNSKVSSEDTKVETEKNMGIKNVKKQATKGKKQKKVRRKRKGKLKSAIAPGKRMTRSGTVNLLQTPKKPSRELKLLQESIKEMFIKDDILNATGIRMCRLAKLVDDQNIENHSNQEEELKSASTKPIVIIEKMNDSVLLDEKIQPKTRKKPGPKPRAKPPITGSNVDPPSKGVKAHTIPKYKPGPKSKKKHFQESDPYSFDDSVSEATTTQTSEPENDSETEDESIASSKSFESSEALAELKKKPKRKKPCWQSGIIKKRRKKETKLDESPLDDSVLLPTKEIVIPDMNCFTDKSYCFLKNVAEYPCRLCEYNGLEIVKHYKTEHPHTEIPLSRMNAVIAREAVEQCVDVNFRAISKMHTDKYICRFCFEEFRRKQKKNVLEEFFWHVVSMHTGEYKQICSECMNINKCPFNLDIPPPPKDLKGQLIGYICGKCNFTQISLENLKTHVIVRHNDEQTEVYTISLAVMSKTTVQLLMKRCNSKDQVQRSLRSSSKAEISEPSDYSDITDSASDVESLKTRSLKKNSKSLVRSKVSFENDVQVSDCPTTAVKVESEDINNDNQSENTQLEEPCLDTEPVHLTTDILDCPHFKISEASSGTKEYVCCINGTDNHYKTNLLISMKRHVQVKHSEIWDGYCSICKVIVMPQGKHQFKECLQHMIDKHIDNFPVLQIAEREIDNEALHAAHLTSNTPNPTSEITSQTYINVRPLTDLFATNVPTLELEEDLPKIQSVVSLGNTTKPQQNSSLDGATSMFKCPLSVEKAPPKPEEPYKYEEMQAEVMSKKHSVILEAMLTTDKLVQIFKCAGRYCSFTTDSADAALLHASTHQRIGGDNALLCTYCDYESKNNAIDLVMHVFKMHGRCPYVCGHCFYRAVASQLVLAHIRRVHGGTGGIVLQTETVTPVDDDSSDILPREVAVQHYVCCDAERTCGFKTYTQGKFAEHLLKHTAPYICNTCSQEMNQPTELLQHMKTHGLKLYQCTWCTEGGDNEGDFLAHSSARHPTRQPQAYLRIFTNNHKDGASKTMVLPLAKLNKSAVQTHLVKPTSIDSNPAREAEKALEMEKLIAAMPTLSKETDNRNLTPIQIHMNQISPQISEEGILTQEGPCVVTPLRFTSTQEDNHLTLVLKKEPIDESHANEESSATVICLDSDEDEGSGEPRQPEKDKQNVVELSDDDRISNPVTETSKKVPLPELLKCNNCKATLKTNQGFKKHVASCFSAHKNYTCAHCVFTTENLEELFNHCFVHGAQDQKPLHSCGICHKIEKSLWSIKCHIKKDHGISNVTVEPLNSSGMYTVIEASPKSKQRPKRKLSGGPALEISSKRIRYGAQDLHNLPQKPILDELAYCLDCEFSTKVRLNLVRHIQQHAENQLVPQTAPVNPVPHLETNEKHFDKMINLASSSIGLGRAEKSTPSVTQHVPPEAALRYPKYVTDRQRYTCGAKECSYTSVDEAMLKIHWETLHASSNDFHCVHCPPNQYLDTSKPLTASRIIAHLKMHDISLYACSSCAYYHFRKQIVEKHLSEVHKGSGQVMVVREESTNVPSAGTPQVTSAAPTMDLKPWKCGLCNFKSMLRPEVIEHCFKFHNTKMQFKCPVCPFRASTLENVTKHKANSHPENKEDVFYYYYREGSVPDEPDGTPRWVKQRQTMGNPEPIEVKSETSDSELQKMLVAPLPPILPASTVSNINLSIVKEEVVDPNAEETMTALCQRFGEFCDPNGLKYKCPLCLTTEDDKEAMRSHLYEELQYRKWACSVCCYKAFHKSGLSDHMATEHARQHRIETIELDPDTRIERWVSRLLDRQSAVIQNSKQNMEKLKIQILPSTANSVEKTSEPYGTSNEIDTDNLIKAFGPLGTPLSSSFSCPKCPYTTSDEGAMRNHLETELNKIRWRCSGCSENSQTYHEAQLHSKTCTTQASRPVEAPRDPAVRAAWLAAVVRAQKLNMTQAPGPPADESMDDLTAPPENSLLVVRYEERVPTPEVEMASRRKRPLPDPAPAPSPDSDDERLVIDEPSADEGDAFKKQDLATKKCQFCNFHTKYNQQLEFHLLRHYNLKPYTCTYCEQSLHRSTLDAHFQRAHPNLPKRFTKTVIPSGPPLVLEFPVVKKSRKSSSSDEMPKSIQTREEMRRDDGPKLICLICEKAFLETETVGHTHDKPTYFAKKGDVVVKCCECLSLLPNINLMHDHNNQFHPNTVMNYAYFRLNCQNRQILQCGHCTKHFKFFRDLKIHHNVVHSALQLKYESKQFHPGAVDIEWESENRRECSKTGDENTSTPLEVTTEPVVNKKSSVAKKTITSTQTIARKSTTKLPAYADSDSESEFSNYGEKSTPLQEFSETII